LVSADAKATARIKGKEDETGCNHAKTPLQLSPERGIRIMLLQNVSYRQLATSK